jgi:hypothetical protein
MTTPARFAPGDRVWLVPGTMSAPTICYRQPVATVVSTDWPYVLVEVDGQRHQVHADNVSATDPTRRERPRSTRLARPAVHPVMLPDGWAEVPLW